MTATTRRSVLAAVGVALASAGCLADPDGGPSDGGTTTGGPTADGTTDGGTTTGDPIRQASNSPDPDVPITVESETDEPRALRVTVVREATGETVFETTAEVSAGGEHTVYNLEEADPEGVEAFRVCAALVDGVTTGTAKTGTTETETGTMETGTPRTGTTATRTPKTTATTDPEDAVRRDCATVETSECHGRVLPTVTEDGSVKVIYTVC